MKYCFFFCIKYLLYINSIQLFYTQQNENDFYHNEKKKHNQAEISDIEVRTMLKTAEELKEKLEQSEAEAASLIGKIVAEKESLKADRDLLLVQLNTAMVKESCSIDIIKKLKNIVHENEIKSHEILLEREKELKIKNESAAITEHAADQIYQLTNELNKVSDVLSNSIRANNNLGNQILKLQEELNNEKTLREKDKIALKIAQKCSEDYSKHLNEINKIEIEKIESSRKIILHEKEILALKIEKKSMEEEILRLQDDVIEMRENNEDKQDHIDYLLKDRDDKEKEFIEYRKNLENYNFENDNKNNIENNIENNITKN